MKLSPKIFNKRATNDKALRVHTAEHKAIIERMFDETHYRAQFLNANVVQPDDFVSHYLNQGVELALNPHPLFNTKFYLTANADVAADGINPLLHYLQYGWKEGRQFHPLFDIKHYKKQVGESQNKERNWILHYLESGGRKDISPHPLFDVTYYREQFNALYPNRLKHSNKTTTASEELELSAPLDLLHYMIRGWKIGLNPNRLFDVNWYLTVNGIQISEEIDPLSHYLMGGFKGSPNFHPVFDTKYYEKAADLVPGVDNALLKFISEMEDRGSRSSPNALIDRHAYLENNSDIRQNNICPYLHFVSHGCREPARRINRLSSQRYIYAECPTESFAETTAYIHYFKNRIEQPKKRLVFVGHEASRTGAPLILLQLMRRAHQMREFDIFLILGRGGELQTEYEAVAHTLVARDGESADLAVQYLLDMMGDDPPVSVIANSVESRRFAHAFGAKGITTTLLVHEMMDVYYDPTESQRELTHLDHIVFPADYVRNGFLRYLSYPKEKTKVIPQGLLEPQFGVGINREAARALVSEEFSFPPDATLVIGCGTVDFRKGADYFVQVAKAMIAKSPKRESLYFLWIGKILSYEFHGLYYWIQYELKKFSLEHRVKFRNEAQEVEDYFKAADLFLLTSRADPFPCVCHEAMAAGVPIVAFEDSGGMPDVLREGAGITVPFGDISMMASSALDLLENDDKKRSIIDCAAAMVKERFDFDSYASQILHLSSAISIESASPRRLNRKMRQDQVKVFFSACDWEISGVNTQATHLVTGLNKRDLDAKILFTRGRLTYHTGEKLKLPDLPSTFIQPASEGHWDVWSITRSFLERQAPCIYVPNYDYTASSISPGLHNRVGIVGIVHSDDAEHYEHVHRLGAYWNRIIAVSDQVLEGVGRINSSYLSKATMIPYGIPVSELKPRALREFSAATPLRLVYLGRFVRRQKRIFDYVSLAKLLDARNIPFHLTLVGEGEERAEITRQLGALINCNKVSLPGRLEPNEVHKLLGESDVLLLLSDFEGLPLALLEAMERGCVPLSYDIRSGIPMILKDRNNGIITPHGKVASVADALAEIVSSPLRFHEMSIQTRKDFASSRFTDDAMCDSYAELFRTVITEICAAKYSRPRKLFTLHSKIGNILPPPFIRSV